MTAHQLANYLLQCPDLPVYINGWGSDEGGWGEETTGAIVVEAKDGDVPQRLKLIYDGPEWIGRPAVKFDSEMQP